MKPPGRLPTIRDLARHLGVNRLTVARAYTELAREGFVRSFVGRGTFLEGEHRHGPGRPEDQACLAWGPMFARGPQRAVQLGLAAEAAGGSDPGLVSLASLFPDPGLFPVEAFGRAVRDVLRDHGPDILGYGPPAGYAPLRRMIA
ncbi:MAG: GntR family transcriptional regulator, partial [Acidobacteriota bacterium]